MWGLGSAAASQSQSHGVAQAAEERYRTAVGGRPERLVSGSDDFTMFLWEPSADKKPLARMTGHMQLINQVRQPPRLAAEAACLAALAASVRPTVNPGARLLQHRVEFSTLD